MANCSSVAVPPESFGGYATVRDETVVLYDLGAHAKSAWAPFALLQRGRLIWDHLRLTVGGLRDIMGR